ncbi:unnamed protein product [Symbiodinium sp. KB8]|nr:unnamed protein product [Symbiodinium sp. KB8]
MSNSNNCGIGNGTAAYSLAHLPGRAQVVEDLQEKEARQAQDWDTEVRKRWRQNFARQHEPLNQPQGQNPGDVSFTRWLCPTSRIHDRQAFHGIRNARMQEVWAVEARQRWHEKHPKPTWREKAVDLSLS